MFEVERDGGSHRVNVGTTPQTRQVQDLWSRDNLTEWKRQSCSEGQWQCSGQELQRQSSSVSFDRTILSSLTEERGP